jgi:hypothetical protein
MRLYEACGADGYPPEWHEIKHEVRAAAGHRCVRCSHPYRCGEHGNGEWSPCDEHCQHGGPMQAKTVSGEWLELGSVDPVYDHDRGWLTRRAQWRILTVHHLNGDKMDCRWWNLVALCQRCHLQIQGKVQMARVWPWEHSMWFKPYVAGYYAHAYLGEDLTREQVDERLEELLALERVA